MALASVFLFRAAVPAVALEGKLIPVLASDRWVILWRSKAAMDEGLALLRARAEPKIVMPLASCAAPRGARAAHTGDSEGSMFSGYALRVTVVDGPAAGCRGYVALKEFGVQVTFGSLAIARDRSAVPWCAWCGAPIRLGIVTAGGVVPVLVSET